MSGWKGSGGWSHQAVCGKKGCMCGNAVSCCECNLDVREMRSAIDSFCGIVVVSSYQEVDFRSGVGGELVAMVSDVVSLSVVRYVVPSGSDERVCKGVK